MDKNVKYRGKLLFISSLDLTTIAVNGVTKKILLEVKTLRNLGFEVDFVEFYRGNVVINDRDKRKIVTPQNSSFYTTMKMFYTTLYKNKSLYCMYNLIYIRYEHISIAMLRFLKAFKKEDTKLVFAELPTYTTLPYQHISFKRKIAFYLKKILNDYFPKDIDHIITFSSHKVIYKIPTIQFENFADVDNLPLRVPKYKENEIHLLALAQLSPAHGFDRVIEGLRVYYQENRSVKFFLHIVGDGSIRKHLEYLTTRYNLDSYIYFHGFKGGAELNALFDQCDIGIGALAVFRKGSYKVSELKIREYTARGLPFIYSAEEPQLRKQSFCLKVPFDESPIDILNLLDFYSFTQEKVRIIQMRDFAEKNFKGENQFRKIIYAIESRKFNM